MPNLTLNLGLRYEFFSQSINLVHNESVEQQTGPHPFWDTSLPLSVTTFPNVNSFFKNIEPSIGFAWSPDSHEEACRSWRICHQCRSRF